jgi:uncharacterized protein
VRVTLDTNVLVATFATRGLCEDVLRAVLTEHDLVLGATILTELSRVLVSKLQMPQARADLVVQFLRDQAAVVNPREAAPWPASDAADRWVVAAAMEGEVDVLVTGDRDLLDLGDTAPITIESPRGFWEMLR